MEKLNFVERIQEILKKGNVPEGRETFRLHIGLRDFLSYIKEKKDIKLEENEINDEEDEKLNNGNNLTASIGIERDLNGYSYVLFNDNKGNEIAIIQDGIQYHIPGSIIKIPESHLERYLLEWMKQIRVNDFEENMETSINKDFNELPNYRDADLNEKMIKIKDLDKKYKTLKKEKDRREKTISRIKQEEHKGILVGTHVLNRFLDEYEKIMEREEPETPNLLSETYTVTYKPTPGEGEPNPRNGSHRVVPKENVYNSEYDEHITEIEKLLGRDNRIDLMNEETGEIDQVGFFHELDPKVYRAGGYMVLIEPANYNDDKPKDKKSTYLQKGGKIAYISKEQIEKLKVRMPKIVDNKEVIGNIMKQIMEKESKISSKTLYHRGSVESYLRRVEAMMLGTVEKGKDLNYLYQLRQTRNKMIEGER